GAFPRAFWIGGYALGVLALIVTRSPILLVVMIVGLFTLWQRWKNPIPGYDAIPRDRRLAIGLAYAVLVVALAVTLPIGMEIHPAAGGSDQATGFPAGRGIVTQMTLPSGSATMKSRWPQGRSSGR